MIGNRERQTFGLLRAVWYGESLAFLHRHRRTGLFIATPCFFSALALLTLR